MYKTIKDNGKEIGLLINPSKTQLLCFHTATTEVTCEANVEGKLIRSGNELKILGFTFDYRPTPSLHIKKTVKKFFKSLWTLHHLKKAKLKREILLKVYSTMLRLFLEYACNVFGPMLKKNQIELLENCPYKALKIIYGYNNAYHELLEKSDLPKLTDRREHLFRKFAIKMSQSKICSTKWLPQMEREGMQMRDRKKYIEFFGRTDRIFNSPIWAALDYRSHIYDALYSCPFVK